MTSYVQEISIKPIADTAAILDGLGRGEAVVHEDRQIKTLAGHLHPCHGVARILTAREKNGCAFPLTRDSIVDVRLGWRWKIGFTRTAKARGGKFTT